MLRITDGRQGRMEPSRDRGRAFQLTFVELRAAPYGVTCIFLSLFLITMFYIMLMCVPLLGMFLVNSLPALVSFESGVSRSFISQ